VGVLSTSPNDAVPAFFPGCFPRFYWDGDHFGGGPDGRGLLPNPGNFGPTYNPFLGPWNPTLGTTTSDICSSRTLFCIVAVGNTTVLLRLVSTAISLGVAGWFRRPTLSRDLKLSHFAGSLGNRHLHHLIWCPQTLLVHSAGRDHPQTIGWGEHAPGH